MGERWPREPDILLFQFLVRCKIFSYDVSVEHSQCKNKNAEEDCIKGYNNAARVQT